MKELIKEETLDIVRQMITDGQVSQEVAEKYFPELKESKNKEDERLRKTTIAFLEDLAEQGYENAVECIDWLNKQGEQNAIVVIPKFRVGDVIVEIKPNGYCQPVRVKYVGEESYSCESDNGKRFLSFPVTSQDEYKLVEQKSAEWSEDDQSNFNELSSFILETYRTEDASRLLIWFKSLKERIQPDKGWIPIKESFYANNVVLAQKKDKSDVWEGYTVISDHTLDPLVFERYINIENISALPHWKPSEEQLVALKHYVDTTMDGEIDLLYQDLNKLREE